MFVMEWHDVNGLKNFGLVKFSWIDLAGEIPRRIVFRIYVAVYFRMFASRFVLQTAAMT